MIGRFGILLIPLIVIFSRLQVEWYWFDQFELGSVYGKRLFLQLAGAFIAFVFVGSCAFWRQSWLRPPQAEKDERRPVLTGYRYGLCLLACLLVMLTVLAIDTRLAWLAWSEPFSLSYWWSLPFSTGWPLLSLSILVLTLIMFGLTRSRRLGLAQVYGSVCICLIVARSWGLWSLALSIPDLGRVEPMLGSDVSFGLGRFSAIALGLELVLLQLLLTLSTALWSQLTRSTCLSDWAFSGLTKRQRHGLRPGCALLLVTCSGLMWLSRHQLLWTQDGIVAGAGWLDVHLLLPLRSAGAVALLVLAIVVLPSPFSSFRRRQLRLILSCIAVASFGLEMVLFPLMHWLVVRPRELQLETPYISRAIEATRQAYQLDRITTQQFDPSPRLSPKDREQGASTLRNIRLWDSQPLLATNRQLQQLRVYYRFTNVAVDRYQLRPDLLERQQVMLAARELDQAALPKRSRTWQNRHFVFTHGYGFTLSPVNSRGADGLPDYFISDIGRSASISGNKFLDISREDVKNNVPIGRAALYFGMLPSPYAVAPTQIEEFNHPEGDENTYNHYSGRAGVPLASLGQRIAASIYIRDPRLLNTGVLQSDSRLLLRRDVKKRVKALAPFLQFKGDPYLVSVPMESGLDQYQEDQHQYWIVDGYTSSNTYPYASILPDGQEMRYVRNSVKAIVDAYNGTVHLYVSEPDDPMIRGWQKVFPELFQPLAAMPPSLRQHLMVPSALFELQVQQLLRYHVTNPRIFYSGDDVWQVPKELYGKTQIPVAPYHITAQVKPSVDSEFLLLQPLTPLARPNLSGWLAARSDAEHYGELILLRFPSDVPIFGPEQIQALINQNPIISQQFGLWDRAGSQVVQGNLLVVPLGNALLYVEPIYLRARRGGLPTLVRVVVSDGSRVAMAKDLRGGLDALLQGTGSKDVVVQDLDKAL